MTRDSQEAVLVVTGENTAMLYDMQFSTSDIKENCRLRYVAEVIAGY